MRDARGRAGPVERVRPEVVIHTAYRQDGEGARETTVEGAAAVAAAAAAAGARLIHLSSDVIFDGAKAAPYDESDPPSPTTEYGQAKADAEHAVAGAAPGRAARPHLADLRRADAVSGTSASPSRRRAARASSAFFDDELRCPVLVGDLASALLELVERPERGVLNVAGAEMVSRYEFACLVAAAAGLGRGADPAHVDRGGRARAAAQLRARQRTRRPACCGPG